MSLNIKNSEVVAAVRRLALERGVDLTEAIRLAVVHELEGGKHVAAARLSRMRSVADRVVALPIRDKRSAEEILGYDAAGIPS